MHKDANRPTHFIQFWSVDKDVHVGSPNKSKKFSIGALLCVGGSARPWHGTISFCAAHSWVFWQLELSVLAFGLTAQLDGILGLLQIAVSVNIGTLCVFCWKPLPVSFCSLLRPVLWSENLEIVSHSSWVPEVERMLVFFSSGLIVPLSYSSSICGVNVPGYGILITFFSSFWDQNHFAGLLCRGGQSWATQKFCHPYELISKWEFISLIVLAADGRLSGYLPFASCTQLENLCLCVSNELKCCIAGLVLVLLVFS